MSFIERLKKITGRVKEEEERKIETTQQNEEEALEDVIQLDVDIFQKPYEIIIVALMPGVSANDLDIFLEGENDVLTIKGTRKRPEEEVGLDEKDSKWILEECEWGPFYRRILLPKEVNPALIKAKLKNGVLILRLPLEEGLSDKRRIKILEEV